MIVVTCQFFMYTSVKTFNTNSEAKEWIDTLLSNQVEFTVTYPE